MDDVYNDFEICSFQNQYFWNVGLISYIISCKMNWLETHTIIAFWTGTNEMSPSRQWHYNKLRAECGCNILLITPENLNQYIHPDHPIHPAYQYLSETHKSDYLRTYMIHWYGGGYCDVKLTTGDWNAHFDLLLNSPDKWINGYAEQEPNHIACDSVRDKWASLIGPGAFIAKPNTPFTTKWYNQMVTLLDSKLSDLEKYPATEPRDCYGNNGSKYPIEWNEMLGRIFHCVCGDFTEHILQTLPRLTAVGDYR